MNEDLQAWVRLAHTPGIGRAKARQLLASLGEPQAIFDASLTTLSQIVSLKDAQQLHHLSDDCLSYIDTVQQWLAINANHHLVTLGDRHYPEAWLKTADPPLFFYAAGRLGLLNNPMLAMVGSRHPTPQGTDNATAFANTLSQAGWTIVSGLALGIDGAAHEGALKGPGSTIAVVGTGLDRVYPKQHRALAHQIAQDGLLISEYPLGAGPLTAHFPQRNRLIAGLSQATLVVEAAIQSGSLITAQQANEMGREVFAIPGSIHSPQSKGCHALIKQGAKLVESVQDMWEELKWSPAHGATVGDTPRIDLEMTAPSSPSHQHLLDTMGYEPVSLDVLCARTGQAPAELQAHLLELELEGHIARLPGQLFQRRTSA